jgi:hypothetical protein
MRLWTERWKIGGRFVHRRRLFAQEKPHEARFPIAAISDSFQAFDQHAKASAGSVPLGSGQRQQPPFLPLANRRDATAASL